MYDSFRLILLAAVPVVLCTQLKHLTSEAHREAIPSNRNLYISSKNQQVEMVCQSMNTPTPSRPSHDPLHWIFNESIMLFFKRTDWLVSGVFTCLISYIKTYPHQALGVYSREQVLQTGNLTLMENSEFSFPEQMVTTSTINSEYYQQVATSKAPNST